MSSIGLVVTERSNELRKGEFAITRYCEGNFQVFEDFFGIDPKRGATDYDWPVEVCLQRCHDVSFDIFDEKRWIATGCVEVSDPKAHHVGQKFLQFVLSPR